MPEDVHTDNIEALRTELAALAQQNHIADKDARVEAIRAALERAGAPETTQAAAAPEHAVPPKAQRRG